MRFPESDPFSFTGISPWVIDSWLSDVFLYQWSRAFGLYSLVYWKWGTIIATFVILRRVGMRVAGDASAGLVAAVFAAVVAQPFLDIRPHLLSLLLLAVLLWLAVESQSERGRRFLVVIPILFLLWANLHAGFILGLVLLPVILFPAYVDPTKRWFAGCATAASVAATFINPNGPAVYRQPVLYALRPHNAFRAIGEWLPPFYGGELAPPIYAFAIALFVIAAVTLLRSEKRGFYLPIIVAGAVTLVMSLAGRRLIPAFAICSSPTIAAALGLHLGKWFRRLPQWVVPAALILLAGWRLFRYPLAPRAFHHLAAEYTFPVETVNFMATNHLAGNTFGYYNWGGFLHWRLGAQTRTFIDGRAGTVFDERTYRDYLQVLACAPGAEAIVDRSASDYVLWPSDGAGQIHRALLRSGRWRLLYQDAVSVLLVRSDKQLSALCETPPSAYKDLAAGVLAMRRNALGDAAASLTRALKQMPYLELACRYLAAVKLAEGMPEEADRVCAKCDAMFPDAQRRARVHAMVRAAKTE